MQQPPSPFDSLADARQEAPIQPDKAATWKVEQPTKAESGGWEPKPIAILQAGNQVGPFVLESAIGAGAFGIVYRAWDPQVGRHVALKIPRPENFGGDEAKSRFECEAKAAARLEHPSIVQVFSADIDGDTPYIASSYCNGPDLGRWLERIGNRPIDPKEVLRFVLQIASAVQYAHQKGVVHRDIKPSNILLVSRDSTPISESTSLDDCIAKLTDFGLAKLTLDPITDSRSSLVLGTPMYMAPEQIVSQWGPISVRTDVFALGVLLYQLLEGQPPRHGMSYSEMIAEQLSNQGPSPLVWTQRTPPLLRSILKRCMETDPVDRYASVQELIHDLELAERGAYQPQTKWSWWERVMRWGRNPKRSTEIIYFIIPLNIVMFLWMIVNGIVILGPLHGGEHRLQDFVQCMGIACFYNLTIVGLSILRLRGYHWASWIALCMTSFTTVAVPLLTVIGLMQMFDGLYAQAPFFRVANHSQILLMGIAESMLLSISIFADWANARRQSYES